MTNHIFVQELWKSLDVVKKNWKTGLWLIVVEAFFFFSYGFVSGTIFAKFIDYLSTIAVHVTGPQVVGNLAAVLEQNPEAKALITPMILLFIFYFVSVYLLYCIIQGYIWFKTKQLTGQKVLWQNYIIGFFKVNLIWFGFYFISLFFNIMNTFQKTVVPQYGGEPRSVFGIILIALLIVIFYFGFISYTLIGRKKLGIFSFGAKHWFTLIPSFLVVGLVILIVNFIASKIFIITQLVSAIIGLILLLPFLIWGRIYLNLVADKLK